MFVMQRYWGNDESIPESQECVENQSDCLSETKKSVTDKFKKKRDLNSLNSEDKQCDVLNDFSETSASKAKKFQSNTTPVTCEIDQSQSKLDFNSKKKRKLNESISISDCNDNRNINGDVISECANKSVKENGKFENTFSRKKKRKREILLCKAKEHEISEVNQQIEDKIIPNQDTPEKNEQDQSLFKKEIKNKSGSKNDKIGNNATKNAKLQDWLVNNDEESTKTDAVFCPIGQVKTKNDESIKGTLPKWLSNPTIIEVDLKGKEIPVVDLEYLDDNTKQNLQKEDIQFLFPVQLAVIPWLLQNKIRQLSIPPSDICVSAPTGSGKTLAFVIPIVQALKGRLVCAVRALIVLPVIELAKQVYKVFEKFTNGTDLKIILLTGQKSFVAEQNALIKSQTHETRSLVDIVITTPGRILDHIHRTKGFSLQSLRYLVIDEADRMMDEIQKGWLKQIENAVYKDENKSCVCFNLDRKRTSIMPTTACDYSVRNQPLQKLLYSATLSYDPERLHSLSLYRPKLFTALSPLQNEEDWIGKCPIPDSLKILCATCNDSIKPMVLCHLVKLYEYKKVLCFADTVERAQRLHIVLEQMGLKVREICSSNRQIQRKIVLEQFSNGKINILVCSDLVARGIDIKDIDCVISYDVPINIKTYIHRIGRTARAGKKGTSVILVSDNEFPIFKKMLKSVAMSMPENINVDMENLKEYVDPFKKALQITDIKLKELKSAARKKKSGIKVRKNKKSLQKNM